MMALIAIYCYIN